MTCRFLHNAVGLFFRLVLVSTLQLLFNKVSLIGILEKEENSDKKNASSSSSLPFVTAGYLPDYRLYIADHLNQTVLHLTDLILFSIDVQPVSLGKNGMLRDACCLSNTHYAKAKQAMAYRKEQFENNRASASSQAEAIEEHYQLRLWVSIGGAGRSNGYKQLYNNKTATKDFIYAILTLVREHDLSGIDFDNEGIANRADFVQYTQLLQNMVVPMLKKYKPDLLLSVTLHVGMTLPLALYQMIDRIHLMAYDLPHAELDSVEKHVDVLIQSGSNNANIGSGSSSSSSTIASKIVLGFPAYGRHRQNVQNVKTFAEIIDESFKGTGSSNSKEGLASSSLSPLIIDTRTEWQNYVFDSPQVVRQKARMARQKGLAGIFMWELGQDKDDQDLAPGGFLAQAMSSGGGATAMTTIASEQRQSPQPQGNDDSSRSRSTIDTTPQGNGEL